MTENSNETKCPNCGVNKIEHYTCHYCGAEYTQDCDQRCIGCGLSLDLWSKWKYINEKFLGLAIDYAVLKSENNRLKQQIEKVSVE